MNCIGALERGERRRPQPHTRRRLAAALGLSDDEWVRPLEGAAAGVGPDGRGRVRPPGKLTPAPAHLSGARDGAERAAAWELYVELVTRIAVAGLGPDSGMLREALGSLYSFFATARSILRKYGAAVARVNDGDTYPFMYVMTTILNQVLRPVLSKWHPLLLDHESRRPAGVSAVEHEWSWERNEELRRVLAETRATLGGYARLLAGMAGVRGLGA